LPNEAKYVDPLRHSSLKTQTLRERKGRVCLLTSF